MNMNKIRKIATLAAVALALTAGAAFANTNTPTVQSRGHSKIQASSQHGVTIGVFTRGHGVGSKTSSPKWR